MSINNQIPIMCIRDISSKYIPKANCSNVYDTDCEVASIFFDHLESIILGDKLTILFYFILEGFRNFYATLN